MVNYAVNRITDGEKVDFKGDARKKQISNSKENVEIKRGNINDDGKINEGVT